MYELGDGYATALDTHRRVIREAMAEWGGVEVGTEGDAFFYAFARASDAAGGAAAAQTALAAGRVRVRMGLHTGEPQVTKEGYVGLDVHTAARIAGCATAARSCSRGAPASSSPTPPSPTWATTG